MKVEETLAQLVAIDSVSARSNAQVIAYAAARAEAAGMRVQFHPYTDAHGVEKINMIAHTCAASPEVEVELALVGHTDTVPYDANWSEALNLTARDGKLYGRGACDTKGFIAAAITAIERYKVRDLRRAVALVLTADEEVGCLGAKRLAETRALSARYSIVGEPTGLQPVRAGKGYCLAEIMVRGREGHSAYPALGASAIFRAARLITRLEDIAEALHDERHGGFDPPHTTLNVGVVQGGTAKNIIAGECRFTLEWRPVPGQKASRVLDLLRAGIEAERSRDPEFDCQLSVSRIDEGMETAEHSTLVRLLEEATGKPSGTISFGTEAPDMQRLGAETVVLGPGDIRVAHRTGEFVPVAELQQCVAILARAIEHFCT
ncbi:MAG TPA: acetylornithine deacetylase [Pyrinomonadaceae bacterium]|jgi:acetylornithine deacetylase|nr:acetylornithine deacetylase [Pyrinomonadaceae bacterium]